MDICLLHHVIRGKNRFQFFLASQKFQEILNSLFSLSFKEYYKKLQNFTVCRILLIINYKLATPLVIVAKISMSGMMDSKTYEVTAETTEWDDILIKKGITTKENVLIAKGLNPLDVRKEFFPPEVDIY
jgi:hypothetical protein